MAVVELAQEQKLASERVLRPGDSGSPQLWPPAALPVPNGFFRGECKFRDHLRTVQQSPTTHEEQTILIDREGKSSGELVPPLPDAVYKGFYKDGATALRDYRRLKGKLFKAGGSITPKYVELENAQDQAQRIFQGIYGSTMVGHIDIYNLSPRINFKGHILQGLRMQPPGMNLHSVSVLVEQVGDKLHLTNNIALPNFEDPRMFKIVNDKGNEELVVSGVEVHAGNDGRLINWVQTFYGTQDLEYWRLITRGPPMMKDINVGQHPDTGEIHFFGRPQWRFRGQNYGPGNTTYGKVPSISHFTSEAISEALPTAMKFPGSEYGGFNNFDFLHNGLMRIDGHRTIRADGGRAYFAFMALYDPEYNNSLDIGITLESEDCVSPDRNPWELQGRESSLRNVIFTGGLDPVDRDTIWVGRNDLWGLSVRSSILAYHYDNMEYYSKLLLAQRQALAA